MLLRSAPVHTRTKGYPAANYIEQYAVTFTNTGNAIANDVNFEFKRNGVLQTTRVGNQWAESGPCRLRPANGVLDLDCGPLAPGQQVTELLAFRSFGSPYVNPNFHQANGLTVAAFGGNPTINRPAFTRSIQDGPLVP